jgi:hypothetical protein
MRNRLGTNEPIAPDRGHRSTRIANEASEVLYSPPRTSSLTYQVLYETFLSRALKTPFLHPGLVLIFVCRSLWIYTVILGWRYMWSSLHAKYSMLRRVCFLKVTSAFRGSLHG